MSNTRNTTARMKNRMEKGERAKDLWSKPHSKGEAIFLSLSVEKVTR